MTIGLETFDYATGFLLQKCFDNEHQFLNSETENKTSLNLFSLYSRFYKTNTVKVTLQTCNFKEKKMQYFFSHFPN